MSADEVAGKVLDVLKPLSAVALARARAGRGFRRGRSGPGMLDELRHDLTQVLATAEEERS
jgi:hypothetical protein